MDIAIGKRYGDEGRVLDSISGLHFSVFHHHGGLGRDSVDVLVHVMHGEEPAEVAVEDSIGPVTCLKVTSGVARATVFLKDDDLPAVIEALQARVAAIQEAADG